MYHANYGNRKVRATSVPESIRSKRPMQFGSAEIYYANLITSRWVQGRKDRRRSMARLRKRTGYPQCKRAVLHATTTLDVASVVKNYGAYETLLKLVLASCMNDVCCDISVPEGSVRRFVARLRLEEVRVEVFMRLQVMPGMILLFDGTSIFSRRLPICRRVCCMSSRRISTGRCFIVSSKDPSPAHPPLWIRYTPRDARTASSRVQGLFFKAERVRASFRRGEVHLYSSAAREDTVAVDPEFLEYGDDSKWDGVFVYNRRTVWYRKRE